MAVLVADVGGTNTRLALFEGAVVVQQAGFRNDDYTGFDAVLQSFGATHDLSGVCAAHIAIAGPVRSDEVRLTNRDWQFDRAVIGQIIGLPGSHVRLFNDLAALGHAVAVLTARQTCQLRNGQGIGNGQALVVGMGTGFNVCLIKRTNQGAVVMETEQGHAALPDIVARQLGDLASHFATGEALFSGRGLSLLDGLITGQTGRDGAQVVTCNRPGAAIEIFAHCLGLYTRQLVFQYMPLDGIYFAGSVARGVLGSERRRDVIAAFEAEGPFQDMVAGVPIHMIADDGAALYGLAQVEHEPGDAVERT